MSSSGQSPVTQQTTQTRDPWAQAQPHLLESMENARGLFESGVGYQPYSGNTTANWLNAYNTPGAQEIYSLAVNQPYGGPGLQNALGQATNMIQNYGLSPEMQNLYNQASTQDNPYLQGAINEQVDRANAGASGMGRYGSGSHDAAIAQAISPIMAQDYARRQQQRQDILTGGLTRQGQWAQNVPGLEDAQFSNAGRLMGLGEMEKSYQQALLDQQLKLWNAQQARPWEQVSRYNAIAGQAGGLGGTQITSSPGATQPSTLQRLLGGSLAGAGLGASIGGLGGAGIGALGGGLLSLL